MTFNNSCLARPSLPRTLPVFAVLLIIIASTLAIAQAGRKISKIEVEGLQRLSADAVITTSGLKPGDTFSVEAIDTAGQKLVDSGMFTKVGYRTHTNGNLVTVVFQIEEAKGGQSPVVFDNFVWFTDDQLAAAIRREVPTFNGSAPDSGNMTDAITRALQNLLKEHNIAGTVEYAPWQASIGSTKQEHLFSVSGVPIPICELHFPGAKNIGEEKLVQSSKQLSDADYSLKSAMAFGTFVLYPLYRDVGQLRAKFGAPMFKMEKSEKCKDGVSLTIPVEEGPIYLWNQAEWTGYEALTPGDLNTALGMKPGDVASGSKFDKGVHQVKMAYGRIGRIDVQVKSEPAYDDVANRVTYKMAVKEGPRYTMGNLTVKGLEESDAEALKERWKLKTSEPFNNAYADQFFKIDAREVLQRIFLGRQAQGKGLPQVRTDYKPNRNALTVDVLIEFKD